MDRFTEDSLKMIKKFEKEHNIKLLYTCCECNEDYIALPMSFETKNGKPICPNCIYKMLADAEKVIFEQLIFGKKEKKENE